MFAGACAAAVCALLVGGTIYSEKLESDPTALGFGGLGAQAMMPSEPVLGTVSPLALNRTNSGSSLTGSSLFDIQLNAEPAAWRPTGR